MSTETNRRIFMNERTLNVLEFDKIIALVMEETSTSVGKEVASTLRPSTELEEVCHLQEETDEALHIIRLNKTVPFSQMHDITDSLKRSRIGSMLDTTECLHVAQVLYTSRNVKMFFENIEENLPLLQEMVVAISPLRHL